MAPPSARPLRTILLLGIGLCCMTSGSSGDSQPSDGQDSPSKHVSTSKTNAQKAADLSQRIGALRYQGSYREALALAARLVDAERGVHRETSWQREDAIRLVQTLEKIAALPADARAEMARADAATLAMEKLFGRGDYEGARDTSLGQLVIRERHLGVMHTETAETLTNLAVICNYLGQYRDAEQYGRRALEVVRELLPAEHPATPRALNNLAYPLKTLGKFDEAEKLFRESLALRRKVHGRRSPEVALALNNLAMCLHKKGDYDAAVPLYRQSLALKRQVLGDDHPQLAFTLNNLALLLQAEGDYLGAEELLRQALAIARKAYNEDHREVTVVMGNLATLLTLKGDFGRAEEMYRATLALQKKSRAGPDPDVANTLNGLGMLLLEDGRLGEALTMLRDALTMRRSVYGDQHLMVARTLHNLGSVHQQKEEWKKAEAYFRDAVELLQQPRYEQQDSAVGMRSALATVLSLQDEPKAQDEAGELFRTLTARNRVRTDHQRVTVFTNYAHFLLRKRSQPVEAIRWYSEAIRAVERLRTHVSGDELDRSRYFTELAGMDCFRGMARAQLAVAADSNQRRGPVADTARQAAFNYVERARGRALLDLMDRSGKDIRSILDHRCEQGGDAEIELRRVRDNESAARMQRAAVERRMQVTMADTTLADDIRKKRLEELRSKLAGAMEDQREAVKGLFDVAREELAVGGLKPATASQLQRSLLPGELLLMYDIGERNSLLFLSQPQQSVLAVELRWPDGAQVTRKSITECIEDALATLTRGSHRSQTAAKAEGVRPSIDALWPTLFPKGIREQVLGARLLYIVPDGPLHFLPFESLPVKGGRFVDAGPPIVYGPSAAMLLACRDRGRAPTTGGQPANGQSPILVAVGDPQFRSSVGGPASGLAHGAPVSGIPRDANASVASRSRLLGPDPPKRLPATAIEVESIANLFRTQFGANPQRIVVLTGKDATVSNVRRSANRPRFLHLATHGYPGGGGRRLYDTALLFAAPIPSDEAGSSLLTLGDLLYEWGGRLHTTELVTLSACQTARGSLQSADGFVALTWGFLYAGARSVVASLWNVNDVSTAILMTEFYRNMLLSKMSKAQALRDAKVTLAALTWNDLSSGRYPLPHESAESTRSPGAGRGSEAVRGSRAGASRTRKPSDRPFEDPYFWAPFILIGGD